MAEATPTVQTAQNNAKTKNKRNRKPQSNYSKPKGEADKRHKHEFDMPPTQVQVDHTLDGQSGVPRPNFSVSGTVQPGDPKIIITVYLYRRDTQTRWPSPATTTNPDSYGNWNIKWNVPDSMAGLCFLKAYISAPEPASDMISLSFA
jgi:hypothetical protein